jgi:general secretion pathway protein G
MARFQKTIFQGYTVAELFIVVIILGILAAIVVPQFSNADQEVRNLSLGETLRGLRGQVELYKIQHGGAIPNLTSDWNALLKTSTFGHPVQTFGPYLAVTPTNPLNGNKNVIDGTGATPTDAACGFIYDYNDGKGSGRIYGTASDGKTVTTY